MTGPYFVHEQPLSRTHRVRWARTLAIWAVAIALPLILPIAVACTRSPS